MRSFRSLDVEIESAADRAARPDDRTTSIPERNYLLTQAARLNDLRRT
ncbi:MAG: hypothetical protein H0T42_07070 [Deltaproteobacteria bacterium]|nr:hypothetical protein [Deltaproteobacteria bacterium]